MTNKDCIKINLRMKNENVETGQKVVNKKDLNQDFVPKILKQGASTCDML